VGNFIYKIGEYRLYKGDPLQSSENTLLQTSLKICAMLAVFSAGVWVGKCLHSDSCHDAFDHLSDLVKATNRSEESKSTNSSFSMIDGNIKSSVLLNAGQSNSNSNVFPSALPSTAVGGSFSSSSSSENGDDAPTAQMNKNFNAEATQRKNSQSFSTVSSASSRTTAELISDKEYILVGTQSQTSSSTTTPRQPT
jgi:hypothetical protein